MSSCCWVVGCSYRLYKQLQAPGYFCVTIISLIPRSSSLHSLQYTQTEWEILAVCDGSNFVLISFESTEQQSVLMLLFEQRCPGFALVRCTIKKLLIVQQFCTQLHTHISAPQNNHNLCQWDGLGVRLMYLYWPPQYEADLTTTAKATNFWAVSWQR